MDHRNGDTGHARPPHQRADPGVRLLGRVLDPRVRHGRGGLRQGIWDRPGGGVVPGALVPPDGVTRPVGRAAARQATTRRAGAAGTEDGGLDMA
ncbi:hypothetical protein I3F58_05995 [Streptomyces sp. MUM 203J]|uniref:hypothetical protein n=1 Tax=Streptomyces sp. MUM 203J TaxID=2791990 RepID=UPI001F04BFD3|nr:hypothetical protein [Streptomyces sp. MUM 203J]MCH0539115.1 hypothetical protein [Streptomyces sp. MUM 203J]